jgi:hypothetical protein
MNMIVINIPKFNIQKNDWLFSFRKVNVTRSAFMLLQALYNTNKMCENSKSEKTFDVLS